MASSRPFHDHLDGKALMRGDDYFDLTRNVRSGSGNPPRLGWVFWLGFILMIVGIVVGVIILFAVLIPVLPLSWSLPVGEGARGGFGDYFLLFAMFIPAFALPLLVWRWINALPVARLVSWTGQIRWGHMVRAILVVAAVYAIGTATEYRLDPAAYEGMERQSDWTGYMILLAITLLLCPIQASSEELMLRGYANHMLVQSAQRLRINPTVAILLTYVVTSGLFASLHLGNPESEGQVGPYMASTFIYGVAMCGLVHLEGGLESAIGYHIANNVFVFSVFGYVDPTLPNSALYWLPEITIGWSDVLWETLWMVGLVAVIVVWNRRAVRSKGPETA